MKKELFIYVLILVVFSILTHPDFINHPLDRIENLPHSGAYGLGFSHPFVFSFVVYVFIYFLRLIIRKIKILFSK